MSTASSEARADINGNDEADISFILLHNVQLLISALAAPLIRCVPVAVPCVECLSVTITPIRQGERPMRFVLEVSIPTENGNATIKDGSLPTTIQAIMEELKPEAAYFAAVGDGFRGGFVVVNIDDASQIPAIAEPFFLAFNATVKFYPVMTAEDLMKAGPAIGAAVQKYA